MQDNACPHMAQCTLKYLEEVEITGFEWPSCSLDLNLAEHIWGRLGKYIPAHTPPINSLNALRTILQEQWEAIPQEQIHGLIDSVPSKL